MEKDAFKSVIAAGILMFILPTIGCALVLYTLRKDSKKAVKVLLWSVLLAASIELIGIRMTINGELNDTDIFTLLGKYFNLVYLWLPKAIMLLIAVLLPNKDPER